MDVIKNNNCSSYNIKENNHNKLKLKKQNCCVITCFIFYIFCISTINNLDKYLHLTTSRYILTYSNILYFISFLSLGVQVELLIGLRCGILPVDKYLKKIKKKLKDIDFFLVYHIVLFVYKFWKYVIRKRIKVKTFCKVGVLLSILNFLIQKRIQNDFFRIFLSLILFIVLFILHICFKIVMRDFMIFQCDLLMNELGFLLIFLNLSDSYYLKNSNTLVICLLRLVSFKILFNSAAHKFVHNSSQWLHLESFQNLFFCQPVPSILSHIANCKFDKKLICFLVIISELLFSWFIFCSSSLRIFFFVLFVSKKLSSVHITCYIICNYIFFSYICLILFFSSFDDSILNSFSYSRGVPALYKNNAIINTSIYLLVSLVDVIILLFYFFVVLINFVPFTEQWNVYDFKCFHFVYYIYCLFCPLNICNSYAMLTYTRSHRGEIVIKELHKMGERYEWKPLYFKNKIDNLNKIGSVLWWGHLPRLEWKLHFFADYFKNENYEKNTYPIYICSFLKKLCMRQEHLASMIGEEQMRRVPLMIRLAYYDYKMSMTG
ncbi:lipase maturation factor, putative [Plasmodium malariae]|uniref:Lipase maturation factor 2 n=1 Tax=Plasmodium malariae TaxID=5858 RepID=A0A1D3JLG5_PLAMA|nr:lipase maturation factor, putative [Plasmodium malariae]SBT87350.1 lipase maturation factor, putative [Plasmodium malariae]